MDRTLVFWWRSWQGSWLLQLLNKQWNNHSYCNALFCWGGEHSRRCYFCLLPEVVCRWLLHTRCLFFVSFGVHISIDQHLLSLLYDFQNLTIVNRLSLLWWSYYSWDDTWWWQMRTGTAWGKDSDGWNVWTSLWTTCSISQMVELKESVCGVGHLADYVPTHLRVHLVYEEQFMLPLSEWLYFIYLFIAMFNMKHCACDKLEIMRQSTKDAMQHNKLHSFVLK